MWILVFCIPRPTILPEPKHLRKRIGQIESSRNTATDGYRSNVLYDNCPAESPDLIVLDFDYVTDLQRSDAARCTGVNHIPRLQRPD